MTKNSPIFFKNEKIDRFNQFDLVRSRSDPFAHFWAFTKKDQNSLPEEADPSLWKGSGRLLTDPGQVLKISKINHFWKSKKGLTYFWT